MSGMENKGYVLLLVISNAVALLQLFAAIKRPRIARLSFFLLFAWACWRNWTASRQEPQVYLEYGEMAWLEYYRDFINGWFSKHIPLIVGCIAVCQGLIAISMLLRGWAYIAGSIGAIVFLLAILPLGVGSGFPCSGIMAVSVYILLRKHDHRFLWQFTTRMVAG